MTTEQHFDPLRSAESGLLDVGGSSEPFPTFESPAQLPCVPDRADALSRLRVGGRLVDFELLRELGAGSFGRVFLARQISLDRLVALKVTGETSGEARALAALEHDNIVRVFGEQVHPGDGLRLLAMQYVPGTTLGRVLEQLSREATAPWTGRDFLEAVARIAAHGGSPVRPDGEWLSGCDGVEVACWLGTRLAEALDHAHRQGILHRDVKPSNVLVHPSGRVLLADFNLAADPREGDSPRCGGTLNYMAPEHLDAFNPDDPTPPEAVDARSDVYSLGVVLYEILTGQRPFTPVPAGAPNVALLTALAAERRQPPPSPRQLRPDVPAALDRVVRRCLEPDPERRYATAGELARVLDGCRALRGWDAAAPGGALGRLARAYPVVTASVLPLVPHVLGAGRVRLFLPVGGGPVRSSARCSAGCPCCTARSSSRSPA